VLAALFTGYKLTRYAVAGRIDLAFANARRVIELERLLHLDFESSLQHVFLHTRGVVVVLNRYYVSMHFTTTLVFLVWVFLVHGERYAHVRRVLVMTTAIALVLHVVFPLAPPRMMPGFVDTMATFGPNAYGSAREASLANQYAAMPSVHFAWSLVVAYGLVHAARARLRWLVAVHPTLTLTAILVTANHYWLDAAAGAAVFLMAYATETRVHARSATAESPAIRLA
jgi:hypothetical protein